MLSCLGGTIHSRGVWGAAYKVGGVWGGTIQSRGCLGEGLQVAQPGESSPAGTCQVCYRAQGKLTVSV